MITRKPELLAPAGSWECVRAAAANGADAIFFGLPKLNARLRADNFTEEDLPALVRYVHERGIKAYVTLNTLVFTHELEQAERYLIELHQTGVDAAIVQDVGLCHLARMVVPDFPIHASTQMTLTSPEGLQFAKKLGITRAVLARELSLRELEKFQKEEVLPLEVFVHGALCVAYSGQCLTSEALGQRSANRGECAQACRLPYQLLVDDVLKDLGDRRYLLSPQDLAAIEEIPRLMELGIESFKIEGRLKTPEYVAAICQVYRKGIDAAWEQSNTPLTDADHYKLEMAFSRGLFSGWMHGVNHQKLVHARYGKKRGAFVGFISKLGPDHVEIESLHTPVKPGDGLVFDTGGNTDQEQGGRLYQVNGDKLHFERGRINTRLLQPGHRVWKTDDPQLNRELKNSFKTDPPIPTQPLRLRVEGALGQPLTLQAGAISVQSKLPLDRADSQPLNSERLQAQLSRLGGTPYHLETLDNQLPDQLILPLSELNRMRRELVTRLEAATEVSVPFTQTIPSQLAGLLQPLRPPTPAPHTQPNLIVLCRSTEQLEAALLEEISTLYVDFEDIRRYREAVELVRTGPGRKIFLATPRIQKAGEQGFFKLIENARPDGVLIRNPGALAYFQNSTLDKVGDFSLNIANPLSASVFHEEGLERLTLSYDLNIEQVMDLLKACPPAWFELTLHQHMPMFHMEHCVFAAFLSDGTDHTNCGRPCDRHHIKLRDRVGAEHPVKADVGCRNTVFHQKAQSGAEYLEQLRKLGLTHFRIELLDENRERSRHILQSYRALLEGRMEPRELVQSLKIHGQLGVTSGTLTVLT
ncbi:MAG: U32 family peptidase [Blastochloris sp.]|nr:U32 family peptidase [Blastochloris sp.]